MTREQVDGIDLRVVVPRLWAARKRIAIAAVVAAILSLVVVSLLPRWYRAEASLLPPEESDLFRNLTVGYQVLKKFPVFGVLGTYHTPADVYRGILISRTVRSAIVDRFELQEVYREKDRDRTLELLRRHLRVVVAPDGSIALRVEDRDPERAAQMANAFLEELDRVSVRERTTRAAKFRVVLERRAHEADSLLHAAELALERYQRTHHTVIPTVDFGGLDAGADLMARREQLQIRIGILGSYLDPGSDELRAARAELIQLEHSLASMPEAQSELERMVRERQVREQVVLFLASELEHAHVRQTMDTPVIMVLDSPRVPESHIRPHRTKSVLVVTILALFAVCIVIGARDDGHPVAASRGSSPELQRS